MRALWPDTFVEEGNLAYNVSLLRKALGETGTNQQYIETVPRLGYRFVGGVREIREEDQDVIIEEQSRARAIVVETLEETPSIAGNRRLFRLALLCAAGLVLAVAAVWVVRNRSAPAGRRVHSLAVLPFVNLSGEPEKEYFSDGLTEELISALAGVEGLRVVSRTTVFQFKGKAQDIRKMGRELNVDAVVEGSVRWQEGRLRVSAQLSGVRDGYQLWSRIYDHEAPGLFTIQEDIARSIVQALRESLSDSSARLLRRSTQNLEAYQLYLQARHHRNRGGDHRARTIPYLRQAVERDPGYADAYALMGICYALTGHGGLMQPVEAFREARAAASRALDLDNSTSEAHVALAMVNLLHDWDWAAAEREFGAAIALSPGSANAHHWFSHYLGAMGRLDESLAASDRAIKLEPADAVVRTHLGWHYLCARKFDQAIEACEKGLEFNPNYTLALIYMRTAYEQSGRFEEAIGALERQGSAVRAAVLRKAFLESGIRGYWSSLLAGALKPRADGSVRAVTVAQLYAMLGQTDEALSWLDRAYRDREPLLVYLNVEPTFDRLRADPRFQALVKKIGLPSGRQ